MRTSDDILGLILVFAPLSLVSIGGGTGIIADIQRQSIGSGWLTPSEFVDFFAISRAAPGPGSMLVVLIGWKVSGLIGALAATFALFLPSSALAYAVSRRWQRYAGQAWHSAFQSGLAPIAGGLIFAGVIAVFQVGATGPLTWAVAIGTALILGFFPRMNPLVLMALGSAIFCIVPLIG